MKFYDAGGKINNIHFFTSSNRNQVQKLIGFKNCHFKSFIGRDVNYDCRINVVVRSAHAAHLFPMLSSSHCETKYQSFSKISSDESTSEPGGLKHAIPADDGSRVIIGQQMRVD